MPDWYGRWQAQDHARHFDGRAGLSRRLLARNLERFNDVSLLNEWSKSAGDFSLLEVGCATGELYRYLGFRHPRAGYCGLDISRSGIDRAREKYPQGKFLLSEPGKSITENLRLLGLPLKWDVVYSKDVLHHQVDPWGFVTHLLEAAGAALILRIRTRDRGPTVLDPELSCQYHYGGWVPYVVVNLEELLEFLKRRAPAAEVLAYRSHMVLGGVENRFLPKECYLPETGTAETAVGVFLKTDQPRRVQVIDREDRAGRPPVVDRILQRMQGTLPRRMG